jgi:Ca2+-transporting ATPase
MSDAGSVPPSPTLSSHTATNFPTTLQLRENQPDENSGLTSLRLLDPGGLTAQRKSSNATFNTDIDGETFRSPSIIVDPSAENSAQYAGSEKRSQVRSSEEQDKPRKKKRGKKEDEAPQVTLTTHQHELAQDESINCAPFRFKPFQLAHMLDPKDLGTLTAFGGTDGIIRGLGTHPVHGLTTTPPHTVGKAPHGAGQGASHRHLPSGGGLPNIILTEPSGKEGLPSDGDDNTPASGSIDDRKRVYGENILPTRISKTLLQLMAAALKDKVLVCSGELPSIPLSQRLSSTIRSCYQLRPWCL